MNGSVRQTEKPRVVIKSLEREFAALDLCARELLQSTPAERLYHPIALPQPDGASINSDPSSSIGELLLKSVGVVEQTCGGLTANLWDDPFEWTLPETLSTHKLISEYFDEVKQVRNKTFARLNDDGELVKLIALPSGETQPLVGLLLQTIARATYYQGQAKVLMEFLTQTRSRAV